MPLAGRSRILILARGEQYAEIDIDTASDVYSVHSSVDGHETPIYPAYYAIRVERNQSCRRQSHTSAGIQTALFCSRSSYNSLGNFRNTSALVPPYETKYQQHFASFLEDNLVRYRTNTRQWNCFLHILSVSILFSRLLKRVYSR